MVTSPPSGSDEERQCRRTENKPGTPLDRNQSTWSWKWKLRTELWEEMHVWGGLWTLNALTVTLLCCCTCVWLSFWSKSHSGLADGHHTSYLPCLYATLAYHILYCIILYIYDLLLYIGWPRLIAFVHLRWKMCACAWTWKTNVVTSSNHNLRRVFGYTKKRHLKKYSWFKISSFLFAASVAWCWSPQSGILTQLIVMPSQWKSMGQGNGTFSGRNVQLGFLLRCFYQFFHTKICLSCETFLGADLLITPEGGFVSV